MAVASYGKEELMDTAKTKAADAKNRRVEIRVETP
jgi:flagellar motor protein MotB